MKYILLIIIILLVLVQKNIRNRYKGKSRKTSTKPNYTLIVAKRLALEIIQVIEKTRQRAAIRLLEIIINYIAEYIIE